LAAQKHEEPTKKKMPLVSNDDNNDNDTDITINDIDNNDARG